MEYYIALKINVLKLGISQKNAGWQAANEMHRMILFMKFKNMQSNTCSILVCTVHAVDPRTTWVWIAWSHLYANCFP